MNRPTPSTTRTAALADDLERNPGIGQSKGSFSNGDDPELIAGENTVDGDVENDSTANAGIPDGPRERTNR